MFVRDLVVASSLGVHAHEKTRRQRVRINVEMTIGAEISGRDDFAEVLNYEAIVAGISAIATGEHIHLVETLADRIAQMCLADSRVSRVEVCVEKLDVYPEAESVGVTIELAR